MKFRGEEMDSKSAVMQEFRTRRGSTGSYDAGVSLTHAIRDKKVKVAFRKFLESEFSVENLDFWTVVEMFRKVTDDKLKRARAIEIFEEYISPSSPSQVNLDFSTRQEIESKLSKSILITTELFDAAQRYIFNIMENDSFVRFVRSKYYHAHHRPGRASAKKFIHGILHSSERTKRSLSPV